MRNWIDQFIGQLLSIKPRNVNTQLEEEAIEEAELQLEVLEEHDVSVEQIRKATEWLRERRDEYLDRWEAAESEYEKVRERAKEAEGPERDDLIVDAEEKRRDAEDRRRQWEQVSARFQVFRRVERQIDNEIEKRRFEQETDAVMEDMDEVMEAIAEQVQSRRREEDNVSSEVKQHLSEVEETAHQKPETSHVREELAEERLVDSELGVGTDYGEDILDDDEDEKEFEVESGGEML
jgi:hypothetical protein